MIKVDASDLNLLFTFLDSLPNPVSLNSYNENGEYDEIVYLNKSFIETLGYTREDIPTDLVWFKKAYPEADYRLYVKKLWFKEIKRAQRKKMPLLALPAKIRCKDGKDRWFDVTTNLSNTLLEKYKMIIFLEIDSPEEVKRKLDSTTKALIQEKQTLQTIINSIPVRVFWKDRAFRYLGCNKIFARDAGFKDETELIGKNDYELSWKEDAALYQEDDKKVMQKNISKIEYEESQTKPNGEVLTLLTSKVPLTNVANETIGVIGTYSDITQRKRLQMENEESQRKLELALEANRDGIWEWDILTGKSYNSPRWKEIIGYEKHELEDNVSSWEDKIHPDDREEVMQDLKEHLEAKTSFYENIHRLKHKNGHWVWILDRGKAQFDENKKAIFMYGTITDISKEHELKENLKRSQKRLQEAEKIANLGSWEWNILTNEAIWSDETYRILGEEPYSFASSYEKYFSFIPSEEHEFIESSISKAIEEKSDIDIEHSFKLRNGKIKYVREQGRIKYDKDDKPYLMLGTVLDITELKEHQKREENRFQLNQKYQLALLEWSKINFKNSNEAVLRATEISADVLCIQRVSVWLLNEDASSIECLDLYTDKNDSHTSSQVLYKKDFPRYFEALETGSLLCVNDARNDPRTSEFTEVYLKPEKIYSMLDVPIMQEGKVIGVVCHEQLHTIKEWSLEEQEFSIAIASTVALSLEIERRKKTEDKLQHQAHHDSLTSLPNRPLFMDRLNQAIKHAHRTETSIAVFFLDLDHFKEINDSLGHAVGDAVLIKVTKLLKQYIRDVDTIARLGGDEFTMMVTSFDSIEQVSKIAQKLINVLQELIVIDQHQLHVTSSIGISIYPNDGQSAETLIRNADSAMYKAKDEGRNAYQFYTADMTERAFERVLMESSLHRALKNEEFTLCYQAQVNAKDNSIIGMEALIRWKHPDLGMVPPSKFIPLAEETGLIVAIDRWVMKNAMQQMKQWYEKGLNPGCLSLNLAMKHLKENDFMQYLKSCLRETQCQPQWIELEITEGQIMKDPENSIKKLNTINDMGISLAIDDFGTGYSSLAYLKRLPVNRLKIDRTFVQDLPNDEDDAAITQAIIALAKSMKMTLIAEGVETVQQRDFLMQQGCFMIQGYLYSQPIDAHAFTQLLKDGFSEDF